MGGMWSKKKKSSVPDGRVAKTPWADGDFDGDFVGGQPNGSGTLRRPDGSTLVGEWARGMPHGQCSAREANGDTYVGSWCKGLCEGTGVWTNAKGDSYDGTWKAGRAHGTGQWTWSNGEMYAGECAFGTKHGVGTYTYANGTTWKGTWDMDRKKAEVGGGATAAPPRPPAHIRGQTHTDKLRSAMHEARSASMCQDNEADEAAAIMGFADAAADAAAADVGKKEETRAARTSSRLRWPSVKRTLSSLNPTSPKARPKSSTVNLPRKGTLTKLNIGLGGLLLEEQPAPEPPRSQPDHTRNCSGIEGIIQGELEAEADAEAEAQTQALIKRKPSLADPRERLVAFYAAHNPGKKDAAEIDATLARYKGREGALFRKLEKKYGVGRFAVGATAGSASPAKLSSLSSSSSLLAGEKEGAGGYAAQLRAFYAEHNPSKIDTVETILERYSGREEKLFAKLRKKYKLPPQDGHVAAPSPPLKM